MVELEPWREGRRGGEKRARPSARARLRTSPSRRGRRTRDVCSDYVCVVAAGIAKGSRLRLRGPKSGRRTAGPTKQVISPSLPRSSDQLVLPRLRIIDGIDALYAMRRRNHGVDAYESHVDWGTYARTHSHLATTARTPPHPIYLRRQRHYETIMDQM